MAGLTDGARDLRSAEREDAGPPAARRSRLEGLESSATAHRESIGLCSSAMTFRGCLTPVGGTTAAETSQERSAMRARSTGVGARSRGHRRRNVPLASRHVRGPAAIHAVGMVGAERSRAEGDRRRNPLACGVEIVGREPTLGRASKHGPSRRDLAVARSRDRERVPCSGDAPWYSNWRKVDLPSRGARVLVVIALRGQDRDRGSRMLESGVAAPMMRAHGEYIVARNELRPPITTIGDLDGGVGRCLCLFDRPRRFGIPRG